MKKILPLLLLFFSLIGNIEATHIIGGELEMVHLGGNRYRIGLNKYFDDVNGNPDAIYPTAIVGIFSKGNNQLRLRLELPIRSNRLVPYSQPACAIGDLKVRHIYYSLEVNLNPNNFAEPTGYYMVWERCCRNNIIDNIVDPQFAGQTMYLEFPPLVRNGDRFINSSPTVFPPLSDYACVNQPFFFDFSGTDADGDELRYSLVAPLSGNSSFSNPRPEPSSAPYPTVQFINGIGVTNMIPGSPSLQINNDGVLSVTASQTGLYVFAVLIEEFRNGQKIGEVRRDYQLLVIDCPTANPPEVRYRSNNENNFYNEGTILEFEAGEDNCGKLFITDIDPNTIIKVRANPVNFDDAGGILQQTTGTISGAGDVLVIDACYPKCPNPSGEPYIVDFIVEDNSCAVPLMDTIRVMVNINLQPNIAPTILTDAQFNAQTQCYEATVKVGDLLTVRVTGDDENGDIITLSAMGDLPPGSNFTGGRGAPPISGTFTWRPDCDALAPDETQRTYNYSVHTHQLQRNRKRYNPCTYQRVFAPKRHFYLANVL
jgi:hypothetical protein